MGFASGSLSFRRFAIVGEQPEQIEQDLLDKLAGYALRVDEIGLPSDVEYGWNGGRHLLDGKFSFENNVYAEAMHFALRVDMNKVPGDLKKAYSLMEEEAVAATNPSGFISKNQKRDVKDIVARKLDEDLRSGRFRRSKLLPVLWDLPTATLYCAANGQNLEQLMELFERTFELTLMPISAGTLALRMLEPQGRRRDYEDLRPTRFVQGPEGEGQWPEYPWVLKGPEPKDYLGNEFLLWLWHEAEGAEGTIKVRGEDVSIVMDRSLDLECAYGMTGKDSMRGTGPTRMPEAHVALRTGKVPRKVGLLLESSGVQFTLTLNPETFQCAGGKLPEIEEAQSPRVVFEERVALLRTCCKTVDSLYEKFLLTRVGSGWEGQVAKISRWIKAAAHKPVSVQLHAGRGEPAGPHVRPISSS